MHKTGFFGVGLQYHNSLKPHCFSVFSYSYSYAEGPFCHTMLSKLLIGSKLCKYER